MTPADTSFYTPAEIAHLWGVNPKTVTRWADAGRIPCVRTPTGRRRFPRDKIDEMLTTLEQPARTEET